MKTGKSNSMLYDEDRICRNLEKWAEVTALCIELRKSVLREKHGIDDDAELTRMVFAEAVRRKEKQWERMTRAGDSTSRAVNSP